jgi:hypothetical protein
MARKTDNLALCLLRATSTLLSIAIVCKIISMMPEDDNNLAEGYAVVFLLLVWSGFWLVCAFIGWIARKFTSLTTRTMPAVTWCAFVALGFYRFAIDFSFDGSPNAVFWLEFALIVTVPIVFGWAWTKTSRQNVSAQP